MMVITCIGDSLTEGDYGIYGKKGIANVCTENYPYFLQKMTNTEVRNFGRCGFRATDYREYYEKGHVNVTGSDIILVMLGTNGGLDDEADTQGNEDYRTLICDLEKDEPKAKIILCTPPHVTVNPKYSNFRKKSSIYGRVYYGSPIIVYRKSDNQTFRGTYRSFSRIKYLSAVFLQKT